MKSSTTTTTKSEERRVVFFVLVLLAPLLSLALIGGYGSIIWVSQMFFGPPTGPG